MSLTEKERIEKERLVRKSRTSEPLPPGTTLVHIGPPLRPRDKSESATPKKR